jgi:hypothetical protein
MTFHADDNPLHDDVPDADALEQRQPADGDGEEERFDTDYIADVLQQSADPSDVIDQAIIVPLPDEDRDDDGADS